MRILPKNIYPNTGGGYIVKIKRGGVKLVYCTSDLDKAIAARDRFLELHGWISQPKPRNTTGVTGISEVTKWFHSRPYDCFQVTLRRHPRQGMRRFFFRGLADRERALRAAVAYRLRGLAQREQEARHG